MNGFLFYVNLAKNREVCYGQRCYLFVERLAWKERQIWPSRTRSHCRAQIEFVIFAGN